MNKFSFTFKEKLREKQDFDRLFQDKKYFFSENFIVYVRSNDVEYSRVAISIKRKVAESVERNRMKRLIREFYRMNKPQKYFDILLIVKNDFSDQKLLEISKELTSLWQKFV